MYIVEKYNEYQKKEILVKKIIFIKTLTLFLLKYKKHSLAIQIPYLNYKALLNYNGKKSILLSFDKTIEKDSNILNKLFELENNISLKVKKILKKRLNINTSLIVFKSSFRTFDDNIVNLKININEKKKPIAFNKNKELIDFENNLINNTKIKTIIDINTVWYKDGIYGINWKLLQLKNNYRFKID